MPMVGTKKTGARVASRTRPENWLAWLDEHVRTLDPPAHWINAPAFMLVRYSHLRPKRPWVEGDANLKGLSLARLTAAQEAYDDERQDFWRDVSSWESKITAWKGARRVLKGLTSEQRQQLAALLSDSILSFTEYRKEKRLKRMFQALIKTGPGQIRKSDRKVRKTIQAARESREYAMHLHPWLKLGRLDKAERILTVVSKTLNRDFREATHNSSQAALIRLAKDSSFREKIDRLAVNPLKFDMVMLYWFFTYECKLPAGESEVRVAMVRNSFWKEFGINGVPYHPKNIGDEPVGCDAVRKAVERFRLDLGTTP